MKLFKLKNKKAFTLLELLVVIAIIGVLASIVMASLSNARSKAKASAIKTQLNNLVTEATILYNNTGSYDTLCDFNTSSANIFQSAFNQSDKLEYQSVCSSSSGNILYANNSQAIVLGGKILTPEKWGASIKLPGSSNYFCVDYSGIAREQSNMGIYFDGGGSGDVDC